MRRFDGEVAVVTGASSGIGRRIALDLADRGATVVGLARREHLLRDTEAAMRRAAPASEVFVCDVSDTDAFTSLLAGIEARCGRIDVLVNVAGIDEPTPAGAGADLDTGLDAYRQLFATNFFAVVAGTLAVLPGMLARGQGTIVNVSSDSARAPQPRLGGYSASKAAVSAFSESVAHEVAGRGVRVHVLYPGWVPTAMGLRAVDAGIERPPRAVRRTEAQVSAAVLRRMGGPRLEINATWLAQLAPIARTVAPRLYARAMRARHPRPA
jgi:NAD(P)-dependent dehydrogenase (short-subunit alcohol dehydrogenase family)